MRRMYSKNQLQQETLEGLKNADVKVKTIEQSQPNWELDIGSYIEDQSTASFKLTSTFSKLLVYGNVLYIVINYVVECFADGSFGGIVITVPNIPEEIGSRVYDSEGKPLTESGAAKTITILFGGKSEDGASSWNAITNAFFNHNGANTLNVYLGAGQSMTSGKKMYYTIRNFVII